MSILGILLIFCRSFIHSALLAKKIPILTARDLLTSAFLNGVRRNEASLQKICVRAHHQRKTWLHPCIKKLFSALVI